jgi:hypothetical protein
MPQVECDDIACKKGTCRTAGGDTYACMKCNGTGYIDRSRLGGTGSGGIATILMWCMGAVLGLAILGALFK